MLPSQQALTKLIGGIYDAAADGSLWAPFLAELAKATQADSAALVMHSLGQEVHTVSAGWQIDPEAGPLYQQHYGAIDLWAMRGRSKPPGYVCTSESLCTNRELLTTEMYNDFLIRFDVEHGMFGVAENNKARWASISLFRRSLSGEFEVADLETLNLLIPHIQRAFKLHFQVSQLTGHAEGIEAALNMLSTGVIFIGANTSVLLANRTAGKILSGKNGLLLTRGKLSAVDYAESLRLQALIVAAVQTGCGKGLSAGGTILISRHTGRSLSVTVAPLREFGNTLSLQRPAAVLFVSDPERNAELSVDMLSRCHGLTPAEARLAVVLAEGHSLKEAASSCRVTHNTARSQLKNIFLKTNTNRQVELVLLLLNTAGVTRPRVESA
jgi:DNA-binding CsgD family transcriptional regulator